MSGLDESELDRLYDIAWRASSGRCDIDWYGMQAALADLLKRYDLTPKTPARVAAPERVRDPRPGRSPAPGQARPDGGA